MLKRPELRGVVDVARDYADTDIVWIGLYDDGAYSVGTDFPSDARLATNVVAGRDRRKSMRRALDILDVMMNESKQTRLVVIKEETDE